MKKIAWGCIVGWMLSLYLGVQPVLAQNSSEPTAVKRDAAKGDNEETLFNTLNETLEENRKIRVAMKELQQALQKKTIEAEDLKSELRKLEALALERNHELGQKVKDLDDQIKASADKSAKFEIEKDEFMKEKKAIKEESHAKELENIKLRKMLGNSVLRDEQEELLKTARENSEMAKQSQEQIIKLNTENQTFKNELATAYYQSGDILFQVKRYGEAVEAYQKVISYDPANSWAYHNLAVIEDYYLNQPQLAYQHYQLYLNYKPADEAAQDVRRRILDLNLLDKVAPTTPLKRDFDKMHRESTNAKF